MQLFATFDKLAFAMRKKTKLLRSFCTEVEATGVIINCVAVVFLVPSFLLVLLTLFFSDSI